MKKTISSAARRRFPNFVAAPVKARTDAGQRDCSGHAARAFTGEATNGCAAGLARFAAIVAFAGLAGASALAAEPARAQFDFFENRIRPIFANHCYKCHSQQAEKIKGGLLLDTREGLLQGGDTGRVIVAGDPEKSLLIEAVRYTNPDLQMPPKGQKLSEAQVADLVAWVKMGAPDPRAATAPRSAGPDTGLAPI